VQSPKPGACKREERVSTGKVRRLRNHAAKAVPSVALMLRGSLFARPHRFVKPRDKTDIASANGCASGSARAGNASPIILGRIDAAARVSYQTFQSGDKTGLGRFWVRRFERSGLELDSLHFQFGCGGRPQLVIKCRMLRSGLLAIIALVFLGLVTLAGMH